MLSYRQKQKKGGGGEEEITCEHFFDYLFTLITAALLIDGSEPFQAIFMKGLIKKE